MKLYCFLRNDLQLDLGQLASCVKIKVPAKDLCTDIIVTVIVIVIPGALFLLTVLDVDVVCMNFERLHRSFAGPLPGRVGVQRFQRRIRG